MNAYEDNLDAVLADMDAMTPTRDHEIQFQNVMEYAAYVHSYRGYYVFSDTEAVKRLKDWLQKVVDAGLPLNDQNLVRALTAMGYDYIGFLQSLTNEMKPAVKEGEGERRAHPGSWADVTKNLANAYAHIVDGMTPVEHEYGN